MSKTIEVTLAKYTPKEGKRPHIFEDSDGKEYSTYKTEIADQAKPLIDKLAKLTITEVVKGDFTNVYLDSAEPAGGNGATPALGTGAYVKGQTAPTDKRSILASVALREAVACLSHTVPTAASAKEAHEKVTPLADAFYLWLARKTGAEGLIQDSNIPF